MKDHKQIRKNLSLWSLDGSPIKDVIDELTRLGEGTVDPFFEMESGGYDGGEEFYVIGWIPMTEKELEAAKKKRKQEREREARIKENMVKDELETLERLAKKHGKKVS